MILISDVFDAMENAWINTQKTLQCFRTSIKAIPETKYDIFLLVFKKLHLS